MNFGKFIRNFSTDPESESSPKKSSLLSGTKQLFGSVNTKTTSLVSGLSNTFEQIKRRTSIESLSFTDKDSVKETENDDQTKEASHTGNDDQKLPYQDAKSYIEQANQNNLNQADYVASLSRKCPPPKPPPPLTKQMSTPHEEERQQNRDTFSRSQTLIDRSYCEEIHQNDYIIQEGGQLANDILEEAKSHLEMECQKIVSAMDDLISFDPTTKNAGNGIKTLEDHNGARPENGNMSQDVSIPERAQSNSEKITEEQREFMDFFVSDMYREGVVQSDETTLFKFKKCIQSRSGRVWFSRLIEKYQYLNSKEIPESIFYRLLHIFTVILLECHDQEDYLPARDLMLVAFGCFTILRTFNKKTSYNFYLSSFISCHPIWKSIEFWNICFSTAIQEVQSKTPMSGRTPMKGTTADGVTFQQLQIHLNYMRSLNLPVDLCTGFVKKQANNVKLTNDEMRRLREILDSWKE